MGICAATESSIQFQRQLIVLWLFGTIAMATIEHTFDDVHVDGYDDDDFDYQLRNSGATLAMPPSLTHSSPSSPSTPSPSASGTPCQVGRGSA